eukprot:c40439_g1_i1 orf=50-1516(-)
MQEMKEVGDEMAEVGGNVKQAGDEMVHVGDEMKQVGEEVGSEMKWMGDEMEKVGAEMQQMGTELEGVGDEMKQIGDQVEKVGTEMQQMGAESEEAGNCIKERPELGEDLIEHILLCLPISSCVKFASLNKHWYSSISKPAFTSCLSALTSGTHPFLFLWGLNPVTLQTLSCLYDPLAARWFVLNLTNNMPPLSSPSHSYSLTCTRLGSLIFYPSCKPSPDSVLLRFALSPTSTDWKISSSASKRFDTFPIVAAFDDSTSSSSSSFKVFILGELYNAATVQLYDAASNEWEVCKTLPPRGGLSQFMGSFQVSSAVVGPKVYLTNVSLGTITCFNIESKSWSTVLQLRAPDARSFLISSTNKGLYALGLCASSEATECLKLFKVDELTMDCKEVSRMPNFLWSLLADQFEQDAPSVLVFSFFRCLGSGSLVYVYNGSYFNKFRVCVCDVNADYEWYQLPALPDPLRDLNVRAQCCSFQLLPTACLQSRYE